MCHHQIISVAYKGSSRKRNEQGQYCLMEAKSHVEHLPFAVSFEQEPC